MTDLHHAVIEAFFRYNNWNQKNLNLLTFVLPDLFFFMIPLSEQYRINIKNAIELIDNTLELVRESNVILTSKHLKDIRKAIAKKPYEKLP